MAREQIILRFAYLKLVSTACIPLTEPLPANSVGNIQIVKLMGYSGLVSQGPHPMPVCDGVRRKVENDRKSVPKDIDDMRSHRRAQTRGTLGVIVDCLQVLGKKG